jgi:hypothetical protein
MDGKRRWMDKVFIERVAADPDAVWADLPDLFL